MRRLTREEFLKSIPEISRLHMECFGTAISPEYLIWRYLENPIKELYVNVAKENGKIVSFYAVSPLFLRYNDENFLSALSLNTMTSPAQSGKGLFVSLAKTTYLQLIQNGYFCVIGFPNVNSNRIFNSALSFPTVSEIPMLELKIDDIDIKTQSIQYDNLFELNYSDEDIIINKIEVKKDNTYLKWRYSKSPEHIYKNIVIADGNKVQAYSVMKTWRDRLNLVEFHANSIDKAYELLEKCILHGKLSGCNYLTVWSQFNSELHHMFERKKFINRYPIHYFIAKQLDHNTAIDITDYRKWIVQMGDNNTY